MIRITLVAVVLAATACTGGSPSLVVGVASSLAEVGEELGQAFPDATVTLSVAGSQVLVSQVREAAPLDVVITADARTVGAIAELASEGSEAVLIAGNRLAIAVAPGNPLEIDSLDDLTDTSVQVVLAAPQVPAGAYTEDLLQAAGIAVLPVSLEASVRGVLTKVRLGEADAGIVYETDLRVGGVDGVAIPEALNPAVEYYAIALTEDGGAFVSFLRSPPAQRVLVEHGFTS